MSSRDNSILNTGMTSPQARAMKQQKDALQSKRREQKSTLLPVAKLLDEKIDRIKSEISEELANLISVDTDKEDVKSIVIGCRLATQKVTRLQQELHAILKTDATKVEVKRG